MGYNRACVSLAPGHHVLGVPWMLASTLLHLPSELYLLLLRAVSSYSEVRLKHRACMKFASMRDRMIKNADFGVWESCAMSHIYDYIEALSWRIR